MLLLIKKLDKVDSVEIIYVVTCEIAQVIYKKAILLIERY